MEKRGFAPAAILVLLLMVAGLGLAVSRTTDLKNVFQKPTIASGIVPKDGRYIGSTEEFTVTGNGTVLTGFVSYFDVPPCNLVRYPLRLDGNLPIADGLFSKAGTISVNMRFESDIGARGSVIVDNYDIPGCGKRSGRRSDFSATLQTPAGKSCMVSATVNGQTITVNPPTGTGGTIKATISRTDTEDIPNIGNPFYRDNNNTGHKYYDITGRSTISNLPAGTYKVFCHIPDEPNKCSGNPFCSSLPANECAGWASCGNQAASGDLVVTVARSKYKCSGTSCERDDTNGTYTDSNCNNACVSQNIPPACQSVVITEAD